MLRSIARESSRMERLVGDLLDATAIESGTLRLQRDWCDLRLAVEAARSVAPSGLRIRLAVDDDVEPVWGDHDRLEQVIVNLLENAATHGRSDHGVDVSLRTADQVAELKVRDYGPGLPADIAERIFEPRVRGGGEPSAGLGLAISRGIVEAHGGTLTTVPVEPGAAFVVRFPADAGPQAAHQAAWKIADIARAVDVP